MTDVVRELYSEHRYPALAHPEADPAVLCVAARCGGLGAPALPETCSVLEVGCASGHHLLALAERYPESRFTGIDFSDLAIRAARQAAEAAGLKNVHFEHADLSDWDPGDAEFDYFIATGMMSWVADGTKTALLSLAARCLTPDGVACIGFNTLPGWAVRQEAAAMVKALPMLAPDGTGLDGLLKVLEEAAGMSSAPYAQYLSSIYADMRRKGPEILPFDDLAPRCDPLHFGQVVEWAGAAGLGYLGESTLPANLPFGMAPEALTKLQPLAADPVRYQQTLDLLSGRPHRTSLFCHAQRPLEQTTTAVVLHFSARLMDHALPSEAVPGEVLEMFHAALAAASPSCRKVSRLMEHTARRLGPRWDPTKASKEIASWLYQAARFGWVELRADEVEVEPVPAERPALSALNLHHARAGQPLVDGFMRTCGFPERHRKVVAALDGSRTRAEIGELAESEAPDLHVEPWLVHLASRGLLKRS